MASAFKLVGPVQVPGSHTTANLTSSGFGTPTAAIVFTHGASGTYGNSGAHQQAGWSFVDATGQAFVGNNRLDGATANQRGSGYVTGDSWSTYGLYLRPYQYRWADFDLITDGVQLNESDGSSGGGLSHVPYMSALLIKCLNAKCGSFASTSTLNGDNVISGLGFQPNIVLLMNGGHTTANVGGSADLCTYGFAVDDGVSIKNGGWSNQIWADALSNVHTRASATHAVWAWATSAIDCRYGVTEMSSGQFTVRNYGPAGGTIKSTWLYYLALQVEEGIDFFSFALPTSTGAWGVTSNGLSGLPVFAMLGGVQHTAYDSVAAATPNSESDFYYVYDGTDELGISQATEDNVSAGSTGDEAYTQWSAKIRAEEGLHLIDFDGVKAFDAGSVSPQSDDLDFTVATAAPAAGVGVGFSLYSQGPTITDFGDENHQWGETGLVITGTNFGT